MQSLGPWGMGMKAAGGCHSAGARITGGIWLATCAIFVPFCRLAGTEAGAIIALPLLSTAWFGGLRAGLIGWVFAAPLSTFLFELAGFDGWQVQVEHWPGAVMSLATIPAAAYLGGLLRRDRAQAAELLAQRAALTTEISQREAAEEALRQANESLEVRIAERTAALGASERRYRMLSENASDLVFSFRLTPPIGYDYVSPSATRLIGYSPEEHYADPELHIRLIHPDDRHLIVDPGQLVDVESTLGCVRVMHRDGRYRWMEFHISRLPDEQGNAIGVEGIGRDVTDRKLEEEAAERRLGLERAVAEASRLLLSDVPDAISQVLALLGQATRVDRAGLLVLDSGQRRTTLTHQWCGPGATPWPHSHRPVANQRIPNWLQLLRCDDILVIGDLAELPEDWRAEQEVLAPDGRGGRVYVRLAGVNGLLGCLILDGGVGCDGWSEEQSGLVRVLADALAAWFERRKAEQTVRDRETMLQTVLGSIRTGVLVVDAVTHQVVEANPEASRLLGHVREELLGRRCHGLVCQAPEGCCPITDLGQPTAQQEQYLLTARGDKVPVLKSVARAEFDGRPVLIESFADLTEMKRLEAKLQHSQKLESLGVLAGGIAHDFNNLLTGVLGYACMLRESIPPEEPLVGYLDQIETSASRAAELTAQMLAYSGRGRFVIQPVDLAGLVQELSGLLTTVISKKADLQLELSESLPVVEGDPSQLRQVVMNLITNASDALNGDPGEVRVRLDLADIDSSWLSGANIHGDVTPGRYVRIAVSDDGSGMDTGTLERIFDPFFTTKFTGRGLGLAAVIGIVRGHRGAIRVDSHPGDGTCFQVLLPPSGAAVSPLQPAPGAADSWHGEGCVLVADDDGAVRRYASRVLRRAGFEVLTAADGQEAVTVYQQHVDELVMVLLDLTMPRLDGGEALSLMRQSGRDVPVLLCSGYSEQEVAERFREMPHCGVIHKPFKPERLIEKVRAIIG